MVSLIVSFCAVLFPSGVLEELFDLTESVSESFPTYSSIMNISIKSQLHRAYAFCLRR